MLRRSNILEIVLVLVVTANGQKKVPPGVSKLSTSDIVDSIRRQLMENNYDYVESREPSSDAARVRAEFPQPKPTMRMQRIFKHRPATYSVSYTKRRLPIELHSRTPKQPLNFQDMYNRPAAPLRQPFNDAKLNDQHELRSDFEGLPSRSQPPNTQRQQTTKTHIYQKQPIKQYVRPSNTDLRNEYSQDTNTQTYNLKYTRKRPSVVHRQPYPKIDVQYSQTPSGDESYLRPSSNKPQQLKYSQPNVEYNQPPNIRVKYTVPPQTRDPPRHPLQRHIKIHKNIHTQSSHTTRKVKSHKVFPRRSRGTTIPEFLWEEDRGPFETERTHATPPGADEPLAKKYHFRADDDTNIHNTHNDSAVHISFIKLLRKGGSRRSGTYRRLIKEESADGIALLTLDHEPLPEFKLPAPWRQYMEGSHSHENLHELL